MKVLLKVFIIALLVVFSGSSVSAQSHAQHDSIVGALLGGIAGAVIGHQSDETEAGAAVGAAAGYVLGYHSGNEKDKRVHQAYYHAPEQRTVVTQRAVIRRDPPPPRVMPYYPRDRGWTCRPPQIVRPRVYVPNYRQYRPYRSYRPYHRSYRRDSGIIRIRADIRIGP